MPTTAITLYTAKPTDGGFRSLATLLAQRQPVHLRDLAELPQPDLSRRQRLRAELVGLRAQRSAVLYCIQVAENNPKRYGHWLPELRRDRDQFEGTIAALALRVGEQGAGHFPTDTTTPC